MRERDIEKRFHRLVLYRGGLTRKYRSSGRKGVPDRIVIWPGGFIHFVELKAEKGKLSALQKHEHRKLRELGCKVFTLHGMAAVVSYLESDDVRGILEHA